jgi:hypothetical protein
MESLVKDVLSLQNTDLDMLAEALALYDIRKADRLKFFLTTRIIEEDSKRLRDWNNMKGAA